MTKLNLEELEDFLRREFPQAQDFLDPSIERIDDTGKVRVRSVMRERNMRPGGTVSGPTMVFLADWTIYVALLAVYGGAAMAVTTSLTINFLRKPGTTDLVAECQLLHSGRRLAMAEVKIYSAGVSGPVAQVTATYALPQS